MQRGGRAASCTSTLHSNEPRQLAGEPLGPSQSAKAPRWPEMREVDSGLQWHWKAGRSGWPTPARVSWRGRLCEDGRRNTCRALSLSSRGKPPKTVEQQSEECTRQWVAEGQSGRWRWRWAAVWWILYVGPAGSREENRLGGSQAAGAEGQEVPTQQRGELLATRVGHAPLRESCLHLLQDLLQFFKSRRREAPVKMHLRDRRPKFELQPNHLQRVLASNR